MATLALSLAGQVVGGAVGGPIGATVGRALGALAGSAIDSMLFAPKPAAVTGADIRLQGSSEGAPIPKLYGWSRMSGNIIWATALERLEAEDAGAKGTSSSDAEPGIAASFAWRSAKARCTASAASGPTGSCWKRPGRRCAFTAARKRKAWTA